MNNPKVYVSVTVMFSEDGIMLPTENVREDGRKYLIDKVLDIRKAAAMKASGQGERFKI